MDKASGGMVVQLLILCVFVVKRERIMCGEREPMIDFDRPLDNWREITVSGTPARPPIIPFLGYEHV